MVRMNAEASTNVSLSNSEIFSLDRLPVATMPNGAKRWNILSGVLPTGEAVEVHESLQPAGIPPNPAHSIQHSELILVMEGTLQFDYDNKSEKVGAGGIIFVAVGTRHSARNIGDGPARYVVVAIGGDAK
jgi:quercetin dioxygenase-like cupin family protein